MKSDEKLNRGLEQIIENPAVKMLFLKVLTMLLRAVVDWVEGQEDYSN